MADMANFYWCVVDSSRAAMTVLRHNTIVVSPSNDLSGSATNAFAGETDSRS